MDTRMKRGAGLIVLAAIICIGVTASGRVPGAGLLIGLGAMGLAGFRLLVPSGRDHKIVGDDFIFRPPNDCATEIARSTRQELDDMRDGILEFKARGKTQPEAVRALMAAGWSSYAATWATENTWRYGSNTVLSKWEE